MKKVFTLLVLALVSIGTAWAESTIFSWKGGAEGATVSGGTVTANNAGTDCTEEDVNTVNADYNVIRLRGAKDYTSNVVVFTLDQALLEGDQIKITGYRNKNAADKQTGFLAKFDKGGSVTTITSELNGCEFINIDTSDASATDKNRGTEPNTITLDVPAAATGSTVITATRALTGTNLFITKVEIVRSESSVITPIGNFSETAINLAPGSSFTAPTLSITDAESNDISSKYSVVYSSSSEKVASVDASGNVTLGSYEGTAKITATFTHTEDGYKDGSASYTITVASELSYPYSWDFTTFGTSGTWEELAADTKNWGVKSETTYQSVVEMSGTITAGGVTIPETNHIKFGTFGKNKLYINKGSLQLNGSKLAITLPDLKEGYYVSIDFENPSGSESRGFKITNINEKGANEEVKLSGSTRETRTFTVTADGNVTLTSTSGIRIYGIRVSSEAPSITVNTTNGYATFSSSAAVDFSASGAEVYTAKVENNMAVLTKVESGKVPANTGVILKSEGSVEGTLIYNAQALADNELVAATKNVKTEGIYILVADGESVKFTTMTSGTLAAGKAYLPAATAARELNLTFGDATGISATKTASSSAEVYNLNGLRVSQPTKGLYIQNGKKVIVK